MSEECYLCGDKHNISEMIETSELFFFNRDDELICDDCSETAMECVNCSNVFNHTPVSHNEYGDTYNFCSQRCYNRRLRECDNCGDLTMNDYECENCYEPDDYYSDDTTGFEFYRPTFQFKNCSTKRYLNTDDYYIGLEVEIINDRQKCFSFNDAKGMTQREINLLKNNVGVKEDCSLSSGGAEFYTLPLQNDKAYIVTKTLCKFFQKNGFYPDSSCGIHIHIGSNKNGGFNKISNNRLRHKLLITYALFQNAIFQYCCPSRINNDFCYRKNFQVNIAMFEKNIHNRLQHLFNSVVGSRYNLLNYYAYSQHNTLEIRSLESTTDFDEIFHWIRFNVYMFKFANRVTMKELVDMTGTWKNLKNVLKKIPTTIEHYEEKHFQAKKGSGIIKHKISSVKQSNRKIKTMIKNRILNDEQKYYSGVVKYVKC